MAEIFIGDLMTKPYTQYDIDDGIFVRYFDVNAKDEDYVWHRDRKDRYIYVLEGNEWKFQFDNQMPFRLMKGSNFFVPKHSWHRIIKGKGSLVLKIVENITYKYY